ncbi:leucyl aminopeptidase [Asanoa iriomotensis]|uniref:Probable cytosol aminopeptidase n=1 Tax=Asanoa iriomotensis TaxID=234613 RepID=A0ABQ4C370_9ACTN|nr:leucyl aminopeptidase [Asanoa iriomotensis]GIF57229.1 leucyl aminopeptidase [Asanoa iriomotensis]
MPTFRFIDPTDVDADTLVVPTRAGAPLTGGLPADVVAMAAEHSGKAGTVEVLPRPTQRPAKVLLVGVGDAGPSGWRAAGAGLARSTARTASVTVSLPADADIRAFAEGVLLGSYRFRLAGPKAGGAPELTEVLLAGAPDEAALTAARVTAETTTLARDLTNMPSDQKTPEWFAERVTAAAAAHDGLTVSVRDPERLAAEGFGGILAVGGGSARGPRLVELAWTPEHATQHVVLVGKGITFDTGGISIKPRDAMKLMRKDMGGAAAIVAATVGAAALRLPVRVTALAPLAENLVNGSAFRPGDVIRHYGGRTSESNNSDAEGRLVLADALAYAVDQLAPDVIVDLATLTGANAVALGKRTAALYSDNDRLAKALADAATDAGEQVWRMPLTADYRDFLSSELADLSSIASEGGAGSVMAALYLAEFAGPLRDRWVHIDMSAPSWADSDSAELTKGATGWGVRTLLRWLATLA